MAHCEKCIHYPICKEDSPYLPDNFANLFPHNEDCTYFKSAADMREVQHAYWTGLTTRDRAQAEGVPWWASDEEKEEYRDWFSNYTHCSNCMAGYDGSKIEHIKYCNFCGAYMDGGKGE